MITGQHVMTVTEATFDHVVLQARLPVLVDFWADWCPPCHLVGPVVEDIATEQAGRLLVAKVDADANPGLVRRYATMSLPSLLVLSTASSGPGSSAPDPSAGSSATWRRSFPRRDAALSAGRRYVGGVIGHNGTTRTTPSDGGLADGIPRRC